MNCYRNSQKGKKKGKKLCPRSKWIAIAIHKKKKKKHFAVFLWIVRDALVCIIRFVLSPWRAERARRDRVLWRQLPFLSLERDRTWENCRRKESTTHPPTSPVESLRGKKGIEERGRGGGECDEISIARLQRLGRYCFAGVTKNLICSVIVLQFFSAYARPNFISLYVHPIK